MRETLERLEFAISKLLDMQTVAMVRGDKIPGFDRGQLKSMLDEIRGALKCADELTEAASGLLNRIDNITTDQFSRGCERRERERLRKSLAASPAAAGRA
jgi:hypothetical protein